jgi:hypothetical protein
MMEELLAKQAMTQREVQQCQEETHQIIRAAGRSTEREQFAERGGSEHQRWKDNLMIIKASSSNERRSSNGSRPPPPLFTERSDLQLLVSKLKDNESSSSSSVSQGGLGSQLSSKASGSRKINPIQLMGE